MAGLLDEILRSKRRELEARRAAVPEAEVAASARGAPPARDFLSAVTREDGIGLIAEIKRASPSAGVIVRDFDPAAIARTYHQAGASAVSVLTDWEHFQGRLEHVAEVRRACPLPILRKDFTLAPYHVYEARAAGADAVLLIAEVLKPDQIVELADLAGDLGLTTLIEGHEGELLRQVAALVHGLGGPVLLGVNNRDLASQTIDLNTTLRLAPQLKDSAPIVSESGIRTREDVLAVQRAGATAILVGESILRAPDMASHIRGLLGITCKAGKKRG